MVTDIFSQLHRKNDGDKYFVEKSICPFRSENILITSVNDTDKCENIYFSLLVNSESIECLDHLPEHYKYCSSNLPGVDKEQNQLDIELL